MKLLKQELDLMSKDNKKEAMRKRRDEKEIELAEKVKIKCHHMSLAILQI